MHACHVLYVIRIWASSYNQLHLYFQSSYGIDLDGPVGVDLDAERVEDTPTLLSSQQMDELRELMDLLAPCDGIGISLYARVETDGRQYLCSCEEA